MLNSCFERQKRRAIEAEVPTEKEKLEELKQTGEWLEKDELEIESKKSYIDNMLQTKKQLELKSQRKSLQDTIDAETAELNKLLFRRNQLVGKTAEDFGIPYNDKTSFLKGLNSHVKMLYNLGHGLV